jgi:DNA invertase Pin-like site-specific DNA recombinase
MTIPQPIPSENPASSQLIACAIYVRGSATQHAEEQLSELRGHAKLLKWLAREYMEEPSTKKGNRRPVLAQLLEDAKAGKFQVVICSTMDRFGRTIKECINNIAVLNDAGIRFKCVSQSMDTDSRSPIGKLNMALLRNFAESEHNLAAERVQLGVARSLREQATAASAGRSRPSKSGKNLSHGAPRKIWHRGRVAELHAQGMGFRQIAAVLGSTYGSVRRALKETCDVDALTTRGAGKQANGDLDGAIADFTEAIQRKPDHATAYRGRGLAKRAKNNLDGANADFAQAEQLEAAKPEQSRSKT